VDKKKASRQSTRLTFFFIRKNP